MIRNGPIGLFVSVVGCLSTIGVAGPLWDEMVLGGGDAGSTPGTAQDATLVGQFRGVRGRLGESTRGGPGDFEDMFLINITNPSTFYASTSSGGAAFDTQLFLFQAGGANDGLGVLANDDISLFDTGSFIAAPDDDGFFPTLPGPGLYYLAITASNNDPLSAGGAVFNQATATEISGPDGPGGASPIIGWTGPTNPLAVGEYLVLPEPSCIALLSLGAMVIVRRPRRDTRG